MSFHRHAARTKAHKAYRKALGRALRSTGGCESPPWEPPTPQIERMLWHLDRLRGLR